MSATLPAPLIEYGCRAGSNQGKAFDKSFSQTVRAQCHHREGVSVQAALRCPTRRRLWANHEQLPNINKYDRSF
jgi:hypothetical protein